MESDNEMTTSLDSYLRGPCKEDRLFLGRLRDTINEVIPIFYARQTDLRLTQGGKTAVTSWPYAVVRDESKVRKQRFSASTHGMILFALDALSPRAKDKYPILIGKSFRPPPLSTQNQEKLRPLVAAAKLGLVKAVNRSRGMPLTNSGTYGTNDPFTLTWLIEIVFRWIDQPDVTSNQLERCKRKIGKAVNAALRRKDILETVETGFGEVPGSFLDVRRLHLAIAAQRLAGRAGSRAKDWIDKNTPELWEKFDDRIHRQLSYSSMGEQKFDPAELAFAFEGALLLHADWISRSTVDQVLEALKLSKDRHPFWRPLTPFLANDRGHVLFLISIEVANSILRACEILGEEEGGPARFTQFESQLRTYAMWLLGEKEEIPATPNLVGWHTEYETKRDIQLWHTSHVLIFLAHYATLLKRKIATEGCQAAGLQERVPKLIKEYWKAEPLHALAVHVKKDDVERQYAVLQRIKKHYIEPWEEQAKNPDTTRLRRKKGRAVRSTGLYSMLLYGPPGTGKTTVAEQMAATLKRPLIIITVSDFLAAGAAEMENRAKGIFEVLCDQEEVVILFDEIDQFLLDRNSKFYQDQDDIFKFMTPGMLTKLQDLRDARNCIFVIATNYYERIDSAIKRRGRIDEHFLLGIPDQQRRLKIIEDFAIKAVQKELEDNYKKQEYEKAAQKGASKRFLEAIRNKKFKNGELRNAVKTAAEAGRDVLKETVLFGWGDLKNLVESKTKLNPGMDIKSLVASLGKATGEVDSAVSLSAYDRRFEGKGAFPFEEFFLLLYLLAESKAELSNQDQKTIGSVLAHICTFPDEPLDKKLLKERGIKDNVIFAKVENYLKQNGCKATPPEKEK